MQISLARGGAAAAARCLVPVGGGEKEKQKRRRRRWWRVGGRRAGHWGEREAGLAPLVVFEATDLDVLKLEATSVGLANKLFGGGGLDLTSGDIRNGFGVGYEVTAC